MLQSMGLQRVRHDQATEQQQYNKYGEKSLFLNADFNFYIKKIEGTHWELSYYFFFFYLEV